MIRIQRNPNPRQLRQFAGAWIGFFVLVGTVVLWRHGWPKALVAWAVALAGGVPGLVFPAAARPLYLLLSYVTFPIGWVISHTALACVYYLVFTPLGVLVRLFGRDALERRFDPHCASYWKPCRTETAAERYFRQY